MRSDNPAPHRRRLQTRPLVVGVAASSLALAGLLCTGPAVPTAAAAPAAATGAPAALTGPQLAASWTGPLSTRGRYVVDANGDRFKLKAGNWSGAQGTWEGSGDVDDVANHQADQKSNNIPLGLDRTPIKRIMADFHALGLNTIRLPYADAMIKDDTVVPDSAVAANPQLKGKTPLQVFDAVVEDLTAEGFAVILNNHTTTYRWCCSLDGNERWNTSQTTEEWIDNWLFLVDRYKSNKRVVGADLRNEVRRDWNDDPNWGWGNEHDLYEAFQQAGNRILEANPDLLIIMEGINWQGIPQAMFPHGRPTLTPVRNLSNTLINSGKLVYSAHFYGFTGPNHTGSTGGWQNGETNDPRYRDLSPEDLVKVVNDQALFVTQEGQHFTAPVWVSEFGTGGRGQSDEKEKDWFNRFTDILVENDTDFAVWPLTGWSTDGKPNDNWALISYDSAGKRQSVLDSGDWRTTSWNKLVNATGKTGQVAEVSHWNMLNLDYGDQNASATMREQADWSEGNRKGNCPDSQRLVALARSNNRGLCTDANQPEKGDGMWTTVIDERYVKNGDWASGYNKLECPENTFAVGYSVNGNSMAALLCAPSAEPLPTTNRLAWFDHGDNRPDSGGSNASDWAPGAYKGQCKDDEYLAGVAYTWKWNHGGAPDALLCRPLD
ncbi:cellulase family glycosylhydrolase [Streptomyces sp. NA04227]|uniref:glycoside hydrolase family 5 protein n=1 Tax=Streptomyces sp. NA04227 TaxID=2742136 RepID=UPI001590D707|nr:cellulase family glycosylhydrolase [Streptomyces sp. NA04227]QKW07894.1 cellulase family glycosylhydrolase [Streptomyces sp. NA04227]